MSMRASIRMDGHDGDGLVCPVCESIYLHQEQVEIGWRIEDQDVDRVVSKHGKLVADSVEAKNVASPNGYGYRRDYIIIFFSCENCGEMLELEIRQHKGNTFISWIEKES